MLNGTGWCESHSDLTQDAFDNAIKINPANAPLGAPGVHRNDDGAVTKTQPLTGIANKFWPIGSVLQVSFTNGNEAQQTRVMQTASEWSNHANIQFEIIPNRVEPAPHIRVTFDGSGNWSNVGTDCLISTKAGASSMNFTNFMPDQDTILHEFGHALGLKHEHQNPKAGIQWNKPEVIKELAKKPNEWSKEKVASNVFNALKDNSLIHSRFDPLSIMTYNFPASWTTNGFSLPRNTKLSPFDISGIGDWYPFGGAQRPSRQPGSDNIRVLTRGVSARMFERRWDGSKWETGSTWSLALSGDITGHPGLSNHNAGSRMAVVARAPSGKPIAAEFSGGRWQDWLELGGEITGSATVMTSDAGEWCFVRGTSGRPFFKRRTIHGKWDTSSNSWTDLGGSITGEISGDSTSEKLALVVRGASGQAALKWWDGQAWKPGLKSWIGLGSEISAKPALVWLGTNLHVVARFPDGTPNHLIYDTVNQRIILSWKPIDGSILGSPTLVRAGRDVMHLLVRGISRRIFKKVWVNAAWSERWENLGGQSLDSPTGLNMPAFGSKMGELHVFVTGVSRAGFTKVWDSSKWHPAGLEWQTLGGQLDWGM